MMSLAQQKSQAFLNVLRNKHKWNSIIKPMSTRKQKQEAVKQSLLDRRKRMSQRNPEKQQKFAERYERIKLKKEQKAKEL